MDVTGSSSSAAILTVDLNTAPAEQKLQTLETRLSTLGSQGGQAQEPVQIQTLKTRIAELEQQIRTTSTAVDAFSKKKLFNAADVSDVERYTRTLKTYADVLDSSGRRLVTFSQYSATTADGVRRLSREFEVSKKVIDETTRNYMSHFEMVSRSARATASNVKSYVEALTATRPGDRGESIQTMNAEYRRMESAVNAVNAANARWNETSADRVRIAVAGLTAENTELSKLGAQYRQLEIQDNRAIAERLTKQQQLEASSYDARRKAALKQIEDRRQAEQAYTAWWAAELRKREQFQIANAVRIAEQRSRLMAFRPETINRQLIAAAPGMSPLAQDYLAQGAIMGGGTARIQAEANAMKALQQQQAAMAASSATVAAAKHKTAAAAGQVAEQLHRVGHQSWRATDGQLALHSALRGVGGALGALWLTYGRFVSVMIAAGAATKTVKDSFSAGLELNFLSQFVATVDTQGNATLSKLRELRGNIAAEVIKISEDSVFTTQENVQALQKLSLAGIEASRGIGLLGTATNAAIFGQTGLAEATGMVLDTLYNFNMASADSIVMANSFDRVGNVMALTAFTVNTTFTDLAKAFQNITGVAGTFNIEIEEASALLQSLAEAGIRGQKAGTFVRNFLDDLLGAPISDRAAATFQRLGIERFNPEDYGRFGVSQYIDELVAKLKQLDFVEQQNAIRAITNQRSRRVLRQELLKSYDEETKLISRVKQLAEEATGSLNKMSEGLKDTGRYALLMAQSAYNASITSAFQNAAGDQVFQDIGRTLQSTFKSDEFKSIVTTFVNGVARMLQVIAKLFSTIVQYKDVVAAAILGLAGGAVLVSLPAIITAVSKAFLGLASAALLASQAMKTALTATIAFAKTNPIAAAVVALTALTVIGTQQWMKYREEKDKALRESGEMSLAERRARSRIESLERQLESAKLHAQHDATGFSDTQVSNLEVRLARARETLREVVGRDQAEVIQTFASALNEYNREMNDRLKDIRPSLIAENLSGQSLLTREFDELNNLAKEFSDRIQEAGRKLDEIRGRIQSGEVEKAEGRSQLGAIAREIADTEDLLDEALRKLQRNVETELFSNVPETIRKYWAEGNKELSEKIEEAKDKLEELRFSSEQSQAIQIYAAQQAANLATAQANAFQNTLRLAEAAGEATDRLREQAKQARETAEGADVFAKTLKDIRDAQDVLAGRSVMSAEALIGMSHIELVALTDELRRQAEQAGMTAEKLLELAAANSDAAIATLEFYKAQALAGVGSLDFIANLQTQINLIREYTAQFTKTQQALSAGRGGGRGGGRSAAVTEVGDVRKVADAEYSQRMAYVNQAKRTLEMRRRFADIGEYQYQQALDAIAEKSIRLGVEREQRVQAEIQRQLGKTKDAGARQRLGSLMEQSQAKQEELTLQARFDVEAKQLRQQLELSKAVKDHSDNLEELARGHRNVGIELAELMAIERQYNPIKRAGDEAVLAITRQYREELEKIDKLIKDSADHPSMLAVHTQARENLIEQMEREKVVARELAEFRANDIRSFQYGWDQAFKEFYDRSTDYASKAREAFETFSKGAHDGFTQFFMNPTKEGFRGLLLAWVDMLRKMASEAMAAKLTQAIFGTPSQPSQGASLLGSFARALVGGATRAPVVERSFTRLAKGGAFGPNVVPFARGSAFDRRGEVLTNPTFFKFAAGGTFRDGVAGEAGDEAVVPLKRMADGRLGVSVDGLGGEAGVGTQTNLRIINAFDGQFVGDYMGSDAGEQVIMNVVRRNATTMRQIVA